MNEFEYSRNIRDSFGSVHRVSIDKVGGGTVGKSYTGESWEAEIKDSDGKIVWKTPSYAVFGTALHIGSSVTHLQAAYVAMEWYESEIEDL